MPPEINFYNPRSLLLFVCILQGIIFAGLLFVRSFRKKTLSDLWLGILLLVMCSSLVTHLIGFANVYDNNQWLTYFPFEIVFALAPTIYLYVKQLTNAKRKFKAKDLLLFVPALIYWIYFFILFMQSMEFKGWYGDNLAGYVQPLIDTSLFIWNFGLLYLSIRHYQQYRLWLNENFSDTELIKFNWLKNFLYIFAALFLLESVFDIISIFYKFSYIQVFYLKLLVAFITYYLAIAGYLRSETIEVDFSPGEVESDQKKSSNSLLDQNELNKSKSTLLRLMETEKPYLDSQLTLKNLSRKLGVNTSVLSRTINKGFGKNFNDFINEYRIKEVKKVLRSDAASDETFLKIAFDNGFNSKATFNRAFKKFTGLSPKEFLRQLRIKN
jgi:AraC-like DNA-binding protein